MEFSIYYFYIILGVYIFGYYLSLYFLNKILKQKGLKRRGFSINPYVTIDYWKLSKLEKNAKLKRKYLIYAWLSGGLHLSCILAMYINIRY